MKAAIEKAGEEYKNLVGQMNATELEREISKLGFIDGATWAAHQLFTKEDMFMWAGYCGGRRMMNPTEDVTVIFEDWLRKNKTPQQG